MRSEVIRLVVAGASLALSGCGPHFEQSLIGSECEDERCASGEQIGSVAPAAPSTMPPAPAMAPVIPPEGSVLIDDFSGTDAAAQSLLWGEWRCAWGDSQSSTCVKVRMRERSFMAIGFSFSSEGTGGARLAELTLPVAAAPVDLSEYQALWYDAALQVTTGVAATSLRVTCRVAASSEPFSFGAPLAVSETDGILHPLLFETFEAATGQSVEVTREECFAHVESIAFEVRPAAVVIDRRVPDLRGSLSIFRLYLGPGQA